MWRNENTDSFKPSWGFLPVVLACLGLGCWKFAYLFTSDVFQSWDLHSHVALVQRLREQLHFGRLLFFDRWWFSGWPALSFYAPGSHLLAAGLSELLQHFGVLESDQLAVHILLGLSLSLLPLTVFRVSLRLRSPGIHGEGQAIFLGLFSCLYAFWFLSHPTKHFGIGIDAAIPLGLYPQVIAWHFLLLLFAEVFAPIPKFQTPKGFRESISCRIPLYLCLLAFTHSISFLFAMGFIVLRYLWNPERFKLLFATAVGLLLSAFWLVPATRWGGEFCPSDKVQSAGGLLSLIFPDSFPRLIHALKSLDFTSSSWLSLFTVLALVLTLKGRNRGNETPHIQIGWVILVSLCFCMSSDYFGLSMPFSLHLYRFLIPGLLLSLPLLTVTLGQSFSASRYKLIAVPFLLVLLWQEVSHLPQAPESKPRALEFAEESEVLKRLHVNEQTEDVRVFFEHLGRPDRTDILSPHYLAARLQQESGRETVNGLFVQSSLSQAFPAFASKRLKIHSYNSKLPIGLTQESNPLLLLERLKDFGVRDLLLDSKVPPPPWAETKEDLGPYRLVHLSGETPRPVESARKLLLGYIDLDGNRPFREIESYFYGRDLLWQKFALIDLTGRSSSPKAIRYFLVNGELEKLKLPLQGKVFHLGDKPPRIPEPFISWEKENERELLSEAELYKELSFEKELLSLTGEAEHSHSAQFHWNSDGQQISLDGLNPGEMYRVNYSYLPFWTAEGAEIFRGDAERIWIEAKSKKATLRYVATGSVWDTVGKGLSVLGIVLLLILRHSNRIPKQDYTS